jgi:gas vesicle protein
MKGSNVAAFLIGALAGGITALLYAPQSGKKTRQQVREFIDEEMEQASEFVERTAAKAKNAVNKGVSQVKQGASHAREFVNNEIAGVKAELCDCDRKTE